MWPKRRHMATTDHQTRPFVVATRSDPTERWAPRWGGLPAALGQPMGLGDGFDADPDPRPAQPPAPLGYDGGGVVEGRGLDDRLGPLGWVAGLEDARPDEDAPGPELHQHG